MQNPFAQSSPTKLTGNRKPSTDTRNVRNAKTPTSGSKLSTLIPDTSQFQLAATVAGPGRAGLFGPPVQTGVPGETRYSGDRVDFDAAGLVAAAGVGDTGQDQSELFPAEG